MIEEPPLLRIARAETRNRPTEAQIAAFRDVPTGFVTDALGGSGAMEPEMKPLPGLPFRMAGPALTCHSGPEDILGLLAAMTQIQPGDVVVNAAGGWRGCAAVGDSVCGMARNAGAAGMVTDGMARDLDGLLEVGLPLFCLGITPNSPFSKGPGTVGLPVMVGGRPVSSGDMIVADRDGVVVVPFDRIDAVIARLHGIRELEAEREANVASGMVCPQAVLDLLDSERTSYVTAAD